MRQAPAFWYDQSNWRGQALAPLSLFWRGGAFLRSLLVKKEVLPGPCICVGNVLVGGSGKTPVVQMIARLLYQAGRKPGVVLRGYGGTIAGPLRVDTSQHDAHHVGDEALLHAALLPTVVARDRILGAKLAFEAGCDVVLFDDGLQNPALQAATKILVLDCETGLGNGRLIPAGPLRESLPHALKRCQAVVLLDEEGCTLAEEIPPGALPVIHARRSIQVAPELYFKPIIAFAGIAHPARFFAGLARKGLQLAATFKFADHHEFTGPELDRIWQAAADKGARVVTTAKDWVRLPAARRADCIVVGLDLDLVSPGSEQVRDFFLSTIAKA